MYKWNNGNGAVLCDYCRIMFVSNITPDQYDLWISSSITSSNPHPKDYCSNRECADKDDACRSDPPAALGEDNE